MPPCAELSCVCLAIDGCSFCAVHIAYDRRVKGDAVIRCYACGARLRVNRRYLVKREGAFHLRPSCSQARPDHYAIRILRESSKETTTWQTA